MERSLPNTLLMALLALAALCPAAGADRTAPVLGLHEKTPKVVAFTNARIVQTPGKTLEKATLVVRDGRIAAIGTGVAAPPDAVIRDLTGKTIYTAFIDLYTHYGMPESAPGSAGDSGGGAVHWNNNVRPEIRAAAIFHPDAKTADTLRQSGFAAVIACPRRGLIRGSAALVLLSDSDASEAIFMDEAAQSMTLKPVGGGYPGSLMGRIALIRQSILDARWYDQCWNAWRSAPSGKDAPEVNLSLAALLSCASGTQPAVFETSDVLDVLRAGSIVREFSLNAWALGSGDEYCRLDAVKASGLKLIIPVNFPKAPDAAEENVAFRTLRHWDFAPENPARLSQAGIQFALTSRGIEKPEDFLKNLRLGVKRGLTADAALAALTTTPAAWLSCSDRLGTLEPGKTANLIIADGDLFEEKTKILDTWVAGERHEVNPLPEADVRGTWTLTLSPSLLPEKTELEISGEAEKPETRVLSGEKGEKKVKTIKTALEKRLLSIAFSADSLGMAGIVRLSGMVENQRLTGRGIWTDGTEFLWSAELREPWKAKPDTAKVEPSEPASFPVVYPEGPFGRETLPAQPDVLLIRNATLWTCGPKGILKDADLLVRKGKIAEVGKGLNAPAGATVIDAAGKHVTPGLIDAHSHMSITGGVNEGSHSVTSETRVRDVLNANDMDIYHHLAFGLTAACTCHGSANTIGGENAIIKLRWGATPEELLLEGQRPVQKFALGENVRHSNITGPLYRFPATRMGVEQLLRDSFQAAKEYRQEWAEYREKSQKDKNLLPPRRDLRLEPLVEILEGNRQLQVHAYRQDEILALIRLAEDMGFTVEFFIHILEGYKVAEALKTHGAMPTTFVDVWSGKAETFDGIPYNATLMYDQGLTVSMHSDFPVTFRQLNHEAAKAVKYGGAPEEEALKFVTINPAKQLRVDRRIGSLEKGKDADFVIWNGPPLSTYTACEQTWIDGRRYFDRDEDRALRDRMEKERAELLRKAAKGGKK
jgi:imidazolonepropionase-like amidohydrolase